MAYDLDKMSVTELEALSYELKGKVADIQTTRMDIQHALSRRIEKDRAEALVAGMSDTERAALAQAVVAAGIASGESVGTPGA